MTDPTHPDDDNPRGIPVPDEHLNGAGLVGDEDDDDDDEGDDEDDDELLGEIEISINPRDEDLAAIGVTPEEFETALMKTLEEYDHEIEIGDPDATSPLEDAEIVLKGKAYRLQEVADIEISGDLDSLSMDDDDEDEDDEPDDAGTTPAR